MDFDTPEQVHEAYCEANIKNTEEFTIEQYNELYAESLFKEADTNHNGIISVKEERDAHRNPLIGSLLKPIAGETTDQYKERVLDILNKYSKVTNTENGKFEKIRELLKQRIETLLGTRYMLNQDKPIEEVLYDAVKDIIE